jgi:PAS domain S-box-containing protein
LAPVLQIGTFVSPTDLSPDQDQQTPRDPRESDGPAPETLERAAALRRGAEGGAPPSPHWRIVSGQAFEALAENVRDYAIFLMNPEGIITFWGEGAHLMKWWTKAQAEGAHLRMLYPDGGAEDGSAEPHLAEAAERGEYNGEGQRVRSDGSTFWAGVTITALRSEHGELLGFAKVTRDLTARRAAEAVLRSASDAAELARTAAEEADRAKSSFLATMSHEIRTPVNAILGYHDLLDSEVAGTLTAKQRHYVQRARQSGQHLRMLIDDVLDLSRLEADRIVVRRMTARLGTVIDSALRIIDSQARAKRVSCTESLAGYAADVAYLGDEDRVRQILLNLLSNAVKFTEPGGRITVSAGTAQSPPPGVQASGESPWAYVRIEDTGSGIPPEQLQAIFEPFVQADMSHTRRHEGTGLGLTISRRLARLMGGDLTAQSTPGLGSTFFVWLPAAAGAMTMSIEGPQVQRVSPDAGENSVLRAVADALTRDQSRILHAFVARLRADSGTPSAHAMREEELEDHLSTFLADIAQSLPVLGVQAEEEPSPELADAAAVQRTVSERHGMQRARLGWREEEIRREFQILREELAAAVRRRVTDERDHQAKETLVALGRFVEVAERTSVASFHRAMRVERAESGQEVEADASVG